MFGQSLIYSESGERKRGDEGRGEERRGLGKRHTDRMCRGDDQDENSICMDLYVCKRVSIHPQPPFLLCPALAWNSTDRLSPIPILPGRVSLSHPRAMACLTTPVALPSAIGRTISQRLGRYAAQKTRESHPLTRYNARHDVCKRMSIIAQSYGADKTTTTRGSNRPAKETRQVGLCG